MEVFKLSIGFVHDGVNITELPMANTGSEAEKVYSEKPKQTGLYDWFCRVVAVSVESIGGVNIASEFIKGGMKEIPEVIKEIPFLDLGGLIIQIQRACWEDTIKNQKFKCTSCGTTLETDIDLERIEIPHTSEVIEEMRIKLRQEVTIDTSAFASAEMEEYNGKKFNQLVFKVAKSRDALRHQAIIKDEVKFWRDMSFDTIKGLELVDDEGNVIDTIGQGYVAKRGKAIFTKDLNSKSLHAVRRGLQVDLPTAKYFYDDTCFECGESTPFFASVGSFFTI